MKVRIEQERIPPGEDPQFHLKLGRGSLSDIEFTVQLLQLMHGAHHESLRTPETMTALDALDAVGLLEPSDADALRESFEFCSAARNARFLVTGLGAGVAAERPRRGRARRPPARLRGPPAGHVAGRLPAPHPTRASGRGAGVLRTRIVANDRPPSTLRPAREACGPEARRISWVAGCSSSVWA